MKKIKENFLVKEKLENSKQKKREVFSTEVNGMRQRVEHDIKNKGKIQKEISESVRVQRDWFQKIKREKKQKRWTKDEIIAELKGKIGRQIINSQISNVDMGLMS